MTSHAATLTHDQQQARHGLVYVRAVASQAGFGLVETPPGEDVLAVDCSMEFSGAAVKVQVKTTRVGQIGGTGDLTYSAKDLWVER